MFFVILHFLFVFSRERRLTLWRTYQEKEQSNKKRSKINSQSFWKAFLNYSFLSLLWGILKRKSRMFTVKHFYFRTTMATVFTNKLVILLRIANFAMPLYMMVLDWSVKVSILTDIIVRAYCRHYGYDGKFRSLGHIFQKKKKKRKDLVCLHPLNRCNL